ncbi:hypothetical protein D3C84_863040 [compost metagenome]
MGASRPLSDTTIETALMHKGIFKLPLHAHQLAVYAVFRCLWYHLNTAVSAGEPTKCMQLNIEVSPAAAGNGRITGACRRLLRARKIQEGSARQGHSCKVEVSHTIIDRSCQR